MPKKPKQHRPVGYVDPAERKKQFDKAFDKKRGSANLRGYNYKWRKARKAFLSRNPLCVRCGEDNRVTAATVVDHIDPHRGDMKKFWDKSNWQPLCKACHDRKTATEDTNFARKGGGAGKIPTV